MSRKTGEMRVITLRAGQGIKCVAQAWFAAEEIPHCEDSCYLPGFSFSKLFNRPWAGHINSKLLRIFESHYWQSGVALSGVVTDSHPHATYLHSSLNMRTKFPTALPNARGREKIE